MSAGPAATQYQVAANWRPTALVVAGSFFMEALDGTVILTAMPQMAESFQVTPVDISIGVTSYVMALSAFIPASAWFADRFGGRRIFALAVLGFTLASMLCGASQTLWQFVGARTLQGIAAALMSPVGRLVVLRQTSKTDIIGAVALLTWPALIAPVVGPPLGGLITTYTTWRWIFLLNVPIGLIGLVLIRFVVPRMPPLPPRPFDLFGFALSTFCMAALVYGIDLLGLGRGFWLQAFGLIALGIALGFAAWLRFNRAAAPLIDLTATRYQTFRLSTLSAGFLARVAINATPYLLPLMFQLVFGMSSFAAGLMLLAYMLGNLVMKSMTTRVLQRVPFRRVLLVNGLLVAISILSCVVLREDSSWLWVMPLLFWAGLVRSMHFTAMNTLSFADVPPEQISSASSVFSMAQQLGFGLGVAVGAVVLRVSQVARGTEAAIDAVDFRNAFLFIGAVALVSVSMFAALPAEAGDALRRKPKA